MSTIVWQTMNINLRWWWARQSWGYHLGNFSSEEPPDLPNDMVVFLAVQNIQASIFIILLQIKIYSLWISTWNPFLTIFSFWFPSLCLCFTYILFSSTPKSDALGGHGTCRLDAVCETWSLCAHPASQPHAGLHCHAHAVSAQEAIFQKSEAVERHCTGVWE